MITTSTPAPFLQISLISILLIWPLWKIFSKAGFSGALALLTLEPVINIFVFFYVAYADWPALRDPDDDV